VYGDYGERHLVAVESPLSVLRHTHQRPHVSTLGSKVTDAQLRLLSNCSSLTLFPDPDKAGYQWCRRILNGLSRSVPINVVVSPYAKVDSSDIDDSTYSNLLDQAVPGALWRPKFYHQLIEYQGIKEGN
jgi:hypothetical protein